MPEFRCSWLESQGFLVMHGHLCPASFDVGQVRAALCLVPQQWEGAFRIQHCPWSSSSGSHSVKAMCTGWRTPCMGLPWE
jgi:hypothetical protein